MKSGTTAYKNLHRDVGRLYGRDARCEDCGTEDSAQFEWANVTDLYEIARENWRRLCAKCHRNFDKSKYIGKKFAGHSHKEESRRKTAESMKAYWKNNRERMEVAHAKASKAKRENNLRRQNGI